MEHGQTDRPATKAPEDQASSTARPRLMENRPRPPVSQRAAEMLRADLGGGGAGGASRTNWTHLVIVPKEPVMQHAGVTGLKEPAMATRHQVP
jgi:hypothetical protein